MNWPSQRDSKADVSSVSPSSERIIRTRMQSLTTRRVIAFKLTEKGHQEEYDKKMIETHCQVALILRSWVESCMIRSLSSQFLALGEERGGRGCTQHNFIWGGSSRGPSSCPFIVHFHILYWPMRISAGIFCPKDGLQDNDYLQKPLKVIPLK